MLPNPPRLLEWFINIIMDPTSSAAVSSSDSSHGVTFDIGYISVCARAHVRLAHENNFEVKSSACKSVRAI